MKSTLLFALLMMPVIHAAEPAPPLPRAEELAAIFRPFETDRMTLSPDGHRVAYTEHKDDSLFLLIRDLRANKLKRILVGKDRAPELSGAAEKTPAALTFLGWATSDRLVFNLNGRNVWSIGADGETPRRLANPTDFQPDASADFLNPNPESTNPLRAALESTIDTIAKDDQPVSVVALPRGSKYAFIEAIMHSRAPASPGSPESGLAGFLDSSIPRNDPKISAPRVVLRVDVDSGAAKEWGETALDAASVLADQAGHPRIATQRRSETSLVTDFLYCAPRGGKWQSLDAALRKEAALYFSESPETSLGERSIPLGFDYDADTLYFASNVGRDTFGVYGLNTKTWRRNDVTVETALADFADPRSSAAPGSALVFDPFHQKLAGIRYAGAEQATLWLAPEIARVQSTLKSALPGKAVEIVEWDQTLNVFLVFAAANGNPGAFYVFHRDTNSLDLVLQRAPALPPGGLNPSASFAFRTVEGANLTGYITASLRPRLKKAPLVVLLHDGPWSRDLPGYNRQAQALAAMGFAVLQVNYRGSSGFGRKHLDALRAGPDTAPLADVLATIDRQFEGGPVDRRLVAIMGTGYGGYLALRALQLHPSRFRCAVAIDAPVDLATWVNPADKFTAALRRGFLGRDAAALHAISPLTQPDKIAAPVMLIQSDGAGANRASDLNTALKKAGGDCTFLSLSPDASADLPVARAALFLKIADFLNVNLYNYAVKLGEAVEKP